jgi:hypothetical protein
MTDLLERRFHRLGTQLSGRLSRPSDDHYAATTAIWAKPKQHRLVTKKLERSILADCGYVVVVGDDPRYRKWSSNTWKIIMSRGNLRQTGQSSITILRGRLITC